MFGANFYGQPQYGQGTVAPGSNYLYPVQVLRGARTKSVNLNVKTTVPVKLFYRATKKIVL